MKTNFTLNLFVVCSIMLLLLGMPYLGQAAPPVQGASPQDSSDEALIEKLKQETGGTVRISFHDETGSVRFIGASLEDAIAQPLISGTQLSPDEAARGFMAVYGKLFGLTDPNKDLAVMTERTLDDGRSFVRFQQTYEGIPVVGGELIVQSNSGNEIISANGEVLPRLNLDVTPHISAETAGQIALSSTAKGYGVAASDLVVSEPELWIYNSVLLGGPGRQTDTLVWQIEVTPVELLPIREFVLVDAQLGFVTLNFNQIHAAKNRTVYDNANNPAFGLPGWGPVRYEGGGATGITDVDLAYDYSGDTYDFFFNEHGRDSLNDGGMGLISTTRYCDPSEPCPFANAFWNGSQMVYGAGYSAADDVVGHELTHGVTDFSSHLFYYYQSGAINESLSDVWGEFVDLTNGAGTDTAATRWQMGEDVPGGGAIRDMEDPPNFGDPDQTDSFYYYCGEGDSGGVHTNSGVNNKAVFLMTDGGYFNGITVSPLGISKVADLYYEVQTNMLTSASGYADLYDLLIQAGVNLGYSALDRQEISDALNAVEMGQKPCSNPTEAAVCTVGGQGPAYLFFDDMENTGSGNWISAAIVGNNEWYYPQTANPYNYDATYARSGKYNLWGYNQYYTGDYYIAMTQDVALPANAYMHFKHDWAFEDGYDGGVLEYSTNGGATWYDAAALLQANGYNGTISSLWGNPLGGRNAFTAESEGYTASRLSLSSLAGQNVRFRFRIGTDTSYSAMGWFIDDVGIYTCAAGNTKPRFLSSGLPFQGLSVNSSKDNAFNLWPYVDDYEDLDSALTFSVCNTPPVGVNVTIDSNKYVDINLTSDWDGIADVCIRATDSGALYADTMLWVTTQGVYLPIILN